MTEQTDTTEEYGEPKEARTFYRWLDKSALVENGCIPLPIWQDALRRYLKKNQFLIGVACCG